jgi:hypothetical protein
MAEVTDETLSKLVDVLNKLEGKSGENKSTTEEKIKAQQKLIDIKNNALKIAREKKDVEDATLKAIEDQIEAEKAKLDNLVKEGKLTEKLANQHAQVITQLEEQAQQQKIINADSDQILTKYLGITSQTKQFSKSMKQSGGFIKLLQARLGGVQKQLAGIDAKALAMNVAFKVGKDLMKNIADTAKNLAKITIEPVKQAVNFENAVRKGRDEIDAFKTSARDLQLIDPGEIEKFRKSSMALSSTFRGTQEDVRNINVELFKTSNAFRELKASNDSAADSLVKTSFLLQRRLNIPLSETAKITEITSQAFGMSAKEAEGFSTTLAVLADNMGLDAKRVFSDFQAQSNNLAKFGLPDLQAEFLELSKIQQKTGISIDSMVGSLEKFTTFEGALTAAAQLNAVFGTTIDGLELMDTVMTEGPVEGFIKLRETLEAAGIQIDQLNYAQMRQLTSTVGLSAEQMRRFGQVSTEELRNITAGSMSAEEAMGKLSAAQGEGETKAEQQKKTMDSLVKAIDSFVTASDKMTMQMLKMAEQSPKTASALEKFGGTALNVLGAAVGGTAGFFLGGGAPGAAVGASLGYTATSAITSQFFAPGDNYISQPTLAKVGEVGTENIQRANATPQTVASSSGVTTILNTGDRVSRDPSTTSGGPTNLTINLVGKEGKIFDTSTQTISQDQMDKAISHYLNTKVSLLNS